ncbi:unnamed protein product [Polarella glacialis]|uniref:Uncharacterized protein n=1 Tax=Polarella glacialis TaxID=89957 RepID=A0A813KIL9_POLGL|nr:unnamed protein product [Polarella glacialis]
MAVTDTETTLRAMLEEHVVDFRRRASQECDAALQKMRAAEEAEHARKRKTLEMEAAALVSMAMAHEPRATHSESFLHSGMVHICVGTDVLSAHLSVVQKLGFFSVQSTGTDDGDLEFVLPETCALDDFLLLMHQLYAPASPLQFTELAVALRVVLVASKLLADDALLLELKRVVKRLVKSEDDAVLLQAFLNRYDLPLFGDLHVAKSMAVSGEDLAVLLVQAAVASGDHAAKLRSVAEQALTTQQGSLDTEKLACAPGFLSSYQGSKWLLALLVLHLSVRQVTQMFMTLSKVEYLELQKCNKYISTAQIRYQRNHKVLRQAFGDFISQHGGAAIVHLGLCSDMPLWLGPVDMEERGRGSCRSTSSLALALAAAVNAAPNVATTPLELWRFEDLCLFFNYWENPLLVLAWFTCRAIWRVMTLSAVCSWLSTSGWCRMNRNSKTVLQAMVALPPHDLAQILEEEVLIALPDDVPVITKLCTDADTLARWATAPKLLSLSIDARRHACSKLCGGHNLTPDVVTFIHDTQS